MSHQVTVGGTGARLTLTVRGYEFPDLKSAPDANWLDGAVELVAGRSGQFTATHDLWLRTDELESFRDELRVLVDSLNGEATLGHLEEQVGCTIRLTDGRGEWEAHVREHIGAGLSVSQAETDQSHLGEALRGLDAIVKAFPVRGKPFE